MKGVSVVAGRREVEVRDAKAALEELRSVASIEGEELLRPFIDADPGFFATLAERLRESMRRHSEIARVEIEVGVDPEEGYVYVGVNLMMRAPLERIHDIRSALFHAWLKDLYREAPLALEVIARPT